MPSDALTELNDLALQSIRRRLILQLRNKRKDVLKLWKTRDEQRPNKEQIF